MAEELAAEADGHAAGAEAAAREVEVLRAEVCVKSGGAACDTAVLRLLCCCCGGGGGNI